MREDSQRTAPPGRARAGNQEGTTASRATGGPIAPLCLLRENSRSKRTRPQTADFASQPIANLCAGGYLPVVTADWQHRSPGVSPARGERRRCLQRQHSIAERRDLLIRGEPVSRVGDPACGEAHEPLRELRCWPWSNVVVQEDWCRGCSAGDVFPSGDGVGVASPLSKLCSISDHSVSDSSFLFGKPSGPCRARSMTWCDSAIVPRLARTRSRASPPREESGANGVRNRVLGMGEDEDAKPVVRSADKRSR